MAWFDGFAGRPAPRRRDRPVRAHRRRRRKRRRCCCCTAIRRRTRCGSASRARSPPTSRSSSPDLRGYGDSTKPAPAATPELDHAQHSKRAMAADMVALMRSLGHERFAVVGHDRGGRVAHRLALDHPRRVARLACSTSCRRSTCTSTTDMRFASCVLPLVLPDPAGAAARADDRRRPGRSTCAGRSAAGAATASAFVEPEALAEYERCFCRADAIHAACEDYRAGGVDRPRARPRVARRRREDRVRPARALGQPRRRRPPLRPARAVARALRAELAGQALDAGHFIPEELPDETVTRLRAFLRS